MATNGLRIGSFAGAAVIIEPTFLLLAAYAVGSAVLSGGPTAAPDALVFVAIIFVAVLIHELGHAGVAALLQIPSERIVLTFFGGYVQFAQQPKQRWREILVSAAGPFANLLCYAVVVAILPIMASQLPSNPPAFGIVRAIQNFGQVSALLGAFNLLPGFPLDGGHILRSVLSYLMTRAWAAMVAGVTGALIGLALVLFGISNQLLWTAFMGVFLALAAWAEVGRNRRQLSASGSQGASTISNANK